MKYLKQYGLWIAALIAIDQLVKLLIHTFCFDESFTILEELLRFRPIVNTNLSWGGNFFAVLRSPILINIINILAILLILAGYSYYRSRVATAGRWVNLVYITGLAGCLCSLIDKLFWGGSLDFVQIPGFFTFDLKDCYLTAAEIIFVVLCIKHQKEIRARDFLRYCFKRKT